jgi:putative hemolysin
VVKTVETWQELEACLKLRFEVFDREYKGSKRQVGLDIDSLDDVNDHLMILDERSGRIIGTYRLNSSQFSNRFYSTNEFAMDQILQKPGNKLELGRACIAKDHRNGAVIALLWRGIAEYIQLTETKLVFGCASVKTTDELEIARLTQLLKNQGHLTEAFEVQPTPHYAPPKLDQNLNAISQSSDESWVDETQKLIPSLLRSYFKAGAKLAGPPALDLDFNCIDFLCVLEIDEMSPLFKSKYLNQERQEA